MNDGGSFKTVISKDIKDSIDVLEQCNYPWERIDDIITKESGFSIKDLMNIEDKQRVTLEIRAKYSRYKSRLNNIVALCRQYKYKYFDYLYNILEESNEVYMALSVSTSTILTCLLNRAIDKNVDIQEVKRIYSNIYSNSKLGLYVAYKMTQLYGYDTLASIYKIVVALLISLLNAEFSIKDDRLLQAIDGLTPARFLVLSNCKDSILRVNNITDLAKVIHNNIVSDTPSRTTCRKALLMGIKEINGIDIPYYNYARDTINILSECLGR